MFCDATSTGISGSERPAVLQGPLQNLSEVPLLAEKMAYMRYHKGLPFARRCVLGYRQADSELENGPSIKEKFGTGSLRSALHTEKILEERSMLNRTRECARFPAPGTPATRPAKLQETIHSTMPSYQTQTPEGSRMRDQIFGTRMPLDSSGRQQGKESRMG